MWYLKHFKAYFSTPLFREFKTLPIYVTLPTGFTFRYAAHL